MDGMNKWISALGATLAGALLTGAAVPAAPAQWNSAPAGSVTFLTSADQPVFDEHYGVPRLVAENSRFQLYIEEEKYNMAIWDRQSGRVYYTAPPAAQAMEEEISGAGRQMIAAQLHVDYIDAPSRVTGTVNSQLGSVRQKTVTLSSIEQGVRILYDFSRESDRFRIPVEYTITEEGFEARIDFAGIEEYGDSLVTSITLLPYFGSVGAGTGAGYLFVPDGSGSVLAFDSAISTSTAYAQPVYGRDDMYSLIQTSAPTEKICLPVFGQYATGGSFLGIIDEGAALATIEAMPAGGDNRFNWINASFLYRATDNSVMSDASWQAKSLLLYAKNASTPERVGVSYRLLGEAGLGDLAGAYRSYLEKTGGLTRLEEADPALYVEFYGAIRKKKSYFGIILDTLVPLTNFEQAQQIMTGLQEDGVDRIVAKYKGVLKGGMDNGAVLNSSLESKLGGNKGFQKLADWADSHQVGLYPDFEFQEIYQGRWGWWSFNIASKMVSQSPATLFPYRRSTYFRNLNAQPYNLMKPGKLSDEIDAFLKKEKLPSSAGVGTGSLGGRLYSDFSSRDFYDRERSKALVTDKLKALSASGRSVLVNDGFDYAALQADVLFGVPTTDSVFDISLTPVPFYAMVFHGYKSMGSQPLNGSEDPWRMFLRCVEQGVAPAFTLTWAEGAETENTAYNHLIGTSHSRWTKTAADYYIQYRKALEGTFHLTITDYEILSRDVRVTVYEDGTRVYLNYGDTAYESEGIQVEPLNYRVVPGGNGGGQA